MNWRCWFRHLWRVHQVGVRIHTGSDDLVIAWKQCERCAASRLLHMLR